MPAEDAPMGVDTVDAICRSAKAIVEMIGHQCVVTVEVPYERLDDDQSSPGRSMSINAFLCGSCDDVHVTLAWNTITSTQWSQEKSDARLFGDPQ